MFITAIMAYFLRKKLKPAANIAASETNLLKEEAVS